MTTSGATNDNEWYNEWQQMTKSDNEWQGMTTIGTTSNNEWQRVTISANFSFFSNKRGAYHNSNVNEAIRAVLNSLFFYEKISHAPKGPKA